MPKQTTEQVMTEAAKIVDNMINPDGMGRNGYVLMAWPLGDKTRLSCVCTNASAPDVIAVMGKHIEREEGGKVEWASARAGD